MREWDAGRHREALVKWQEAAREGDTRSMMALGRLYMKGLGAPQVYIEAHKRIKLGSSIVETNQSRNRQDCLETLQTQIFA